MTEEIGRANEVGRKTPGERAGENFPVKIFCAV